MNAVIRRSLLLVAFLALSAGCIRPVAKAPVRALLLGTSGPHAWIDAPLTGMHLPLAPYEVVFHVTDDTGVVTGELAVNGQVLASLPNPDPSQKLATLRQVWSPAAPGEYTLFARGQNTAGAWGESVPVIVTVGDLTPTRSLTPTPGTSTSTPTLTPTPTPTPAAGFSPPALSSMGFYYGFGSCDPRQVTLRVRVTDPRGVKVVVFFERLKDKASGETTGWSDGESMNPLANGEFQFTLDGNAVGPSSGFAEAYVLYQFVAQLKDGSSLRSPVYSDLTLGRCGLVILPIEILPLPLLPTTPAPPPIIK